MSSRFECVRRKIHWGVRDKKNPNAPSGAVLELVPLEPKKGQSEGVRVQWKHDDGTWTSSRHVTQTLTDSEVETFWKCFVDLINESANARRARGKGGKGGEGPDGVGDLYHDFEAQCFDVRAEKGCVNCECFVSLILTGKEAPVLGNVLSRLKIPRGLLTMSRDSSDSSSER